MTEDLVMTPAPSFADTIAGHEHIYQLVCISLELHPTYTSAQHVEWVGNMLDQARNQRGQH